MEDFHIHQMEVQLLELGCNEGVRTLEVVAHTAGNLAVQQNPAVDVAGHFALVLEKTAKMWDKNVE